MTQLAERERALGFDRLDGHLSFSPQVMETKWRLLEFLIASRRDGKRIAGYGAPGKGNTLLNYCGIRTDFLDYTVDRSPYKQGKFLPGTHVPILSPERIAETARLAAWPIPEDLWPELDALAAPRETWLY